MDINYSSFMGKCVCGREVLKVRVHNTQYTLCDICYKDSSPNLSGMTDDTLSDVIKNLKEVLGETNEFVKNFIEAVAVERVCRKL